MGCKVLVLCRQQYWHPNVKCFFIWYYILMYRSLNQHHINVDDWNRFSF